MLVEDNADDAGALLGQTLGGGKYRIDRLLGSGGYGEVYEATNLNTGRRVAIKALHAHLVRNAGVWQRFRQEAQAATKVVHENVIDVFDLEFDAEKSRPFIVQEFLSGEPLSDRLDNQPGQRLAPLDAMRIAIPVMDALAAAHASGIIHRDLKPENIFLTVDRLGREVPKVIDFGIAKLVDNTEGGTKSTRTGMLLGTPAYMSPEQAMGDVTLIDAQSDVWAMGVVLYEMLSGRLPYEAENSTITVGMIQFREPVRLAERDPSLPSDVVAVVERALTRERAARFASMQAFLDALLATNVCRDEGLVSPSRPSIQIDRGPPVRPPRLASLVEVQAPPAGDPTPSDLTPDASHSSTLVEAAAPARSDPPRVVTSPYKKARSLSPLPVPRRSDAPPERRARRPVVLVAAGLIVAVALACAALVVTLQGRSSATARDAAAALVARPSPPPPAAPVAPPAVPVTPVVVDAPDAAARPADATPSAVDDASSLARDDDAARPRRHRHRAYGDRRGHELAPDTEWRP
jgi:serine/threonine-protein kinase